VGDADQEKPPPVGLVRVSDARGREGPAFISPGEQRDKCRSYAAAFEHEIIDVGEELDRSVRRPPRHA
jgi:hypothetical protein